MAVIVGGRMISRRLELPRNVLPFKAVSEVPERFTRVNLDPMNVPYGLLPANEEKAGLEMTRFPWIGHPWKV